MNEVEESFIRKIIEKHSKGLSFTKKEKGLFYTKTVKSLEIGIEDNQCYLACDNRTSDCWIEEFNYLAEVKYYLDDKGNAEEAKEWFVGIKTLIEVGISYCDEKDKSTAFMLQYLQDTTELSLDEVMDYLMSIWKK